MNPVKNSVLATTAAVTLITFSIPDAEGIVRRHDVDDEQYIQLGDTFPSVGMFERNNNVEASGVLIHSRWVLTAAHLANPDTITFDGGDTLYTVAEFHRHPDWDSDAGGPLDTGVENDIALARLESPVAGITPSAWYTGSDELGQAAVSVGFGRSGTGETGEQAGTAGTRRGAENTIARLGTGAPLTPPATAFEYDFNAPGDIGVQPLEGMGVFRDSGGPVMVDFNDGAGYVIAGIHSYVIDQDGEGRGTYGDVMGSTRVSLYDDWITATIPEPRTWSLLAGLAVFGVVVLRRRLGAKG